MNIAARNIGVVVGFALVVFFIAGYGMGYNSGETTATDAYAAIPAPTPEVITVTITPEPVVQPTPEIREVVREVTPAACTDAINATWDLIDNQSAWLTALSDGNYAETDRLVEITGTILEDFAAAANRCH